MNFEIMFVIENIIISAVSGYIYFNKNNVDTKQHIVKSLESILSSIINYLININNKYFTDNKVTLKNNKVPFFMNNKKCIRTVSAANIDGNKINNCDLSNQNITHNLSSVYPSYRNTQKISKIDCNKHKKLHRIKSNPQNNVPLVQNFDYEDNKRMDNCIFVIESYDDEDDIYFDCGFHQNNSEIMMESSLTNLYDGCLLDHNSKSICDTYHSSNNHIYT